MSSEPPGSGSAEQLRAALSAPWERYRLYFEAAPVGLFVIDEGGRSGDDAAIVAAIIDLAANLGLEVIAEGIETEQRLALVRTFGSKEAQGYLLGRPQPAANLELAAPRLAPQAGQRSALRRASRED